MPLQLNRLHRRKRVIPEDRFYAGFFTLLRKLNRPEHVGVIGQGQGGSPLPLRELHQFIDLRQGLEEAVMGVRVEVGEAGGHFRGISTA